MRREDQLVFHCSIRSCIYPLSHGLSSRHGYHQHRTSLYVPAILAPPVVFAGLVVVLWSWKCRITVLFQNNSSTYLPPKARYETIADVKNDAETKNGGRKRYDLEKAQESVGVWQVLTVAENIRRIQEEYILCISGL
jgi:hypothetical protein